jgi:cobalamin biosynthesis protein CobW
VFRIKGRAAIAGKPAPAMVQAVGPRLETWFAPGDAPAGLVVIGLKDIDQAAIVRALTE